MTSPITAFPGAVGAWREGVLYRFPNLFGATVDITRTATAYAATCFGCGSTSLPGHAGQVIEWAQEHSGKCRGLPRPTT